MMGKEADSMSASWYDIKRFGIIRRIPTREWVNFGERRPEMKRSMLLHLLMWFQLQTQWNPFRVPLLLCVGGVNYHSSLVIMDADKTITAFDKDIQILFIQHSIRGLVGGVMNQEIVCQRP